MESVQTLVVVHKASLPLMDGESVYDYNAKFQAAATAHIRQKLNLSSKDEVWGVETFGDSAVFSVYLDANANANANANAAAIAAANATKPRHRYYSVAYSRDSNGKFTFGSTTEVQRITTFQPVSPVIKAKGSATDPAEVERVHKASWTPRRFWDGVL